MPIADAAEPNRKVTRSHLLRYSSLKDFKFDVPDGWDDRNVAIFLDSCFANLEALRTYTTTGDEATWKAVARSGLEKSGSIKCFTVNCCLELSNCLKKYVAKKKETLDNEIFKRLQADVEALLPYWQTPGASTSATPSTPRSDPKPFEKLVEAATPDQTNLLAVPPFTTHVETEKAVRVIAELLKEHYKDDPSKLSFRNPVWKEVNSSIEKDFGVSVNLRVFLENYKTSIVHIVKQIDDVVEREKCFLELTDGLLPFFDSIPPRSIKKMEFIISTEGASLERLNKNLSLKKSNKKTQDVFESGNLVMTAYEPPSGVNNDATNLNPTTAEMTEDCVTEAVDDVKVPESPQPDQPPPDISMELVEEANSPGKNDAAVEPAHEPIVVEVQEPPPLPKQPTRRKRVPPTEVVVKRTRRTLALAAESKTLAENAAIAATTKIVETSNETKTSDALTAPCPEATSKSLSGSSLNLTVDNKPEVTAAESDSDESEEICLLGTNIRSHRSITAEKISATPSCDRMNPVVVLDKINAERYLEAALSTRRRRKPSKKSLPTPKRRASPSSTPALTSSHPSTSTALVPRRRGRPPKNSKLLPIRPSPSTSAGSGNTSYDQIHSSLLMRTAGSSSTPQPHVSSRMIDLTANRLSYSQQVFNGWPSTFAHSGILRATWNHEVHSLMDLMVPRRPEDARMGESARPAIKNLENKSPSFSPPHNPSTTIDATTTKRINNYVVPSTSSGAVALPGSTNGEPPSWFVQFVEETRRREQWKTAQIFRMHDQVIESMKSKTVILEEILATLNGSSSGAGSGS